MTTSDPVARRASALLASVGAGDPTAVHKYDALVFPLLRDTALRRGRFLAAGVAERAGGGSGPFVQPADLEEVAVVAAEVALERARASARRFDPAKGDGVSWALGALGGAYLDAMRQQTRSRRIMRELPLEKVDEVDPYAGSSGDPYTLVEARDSLRRALAELDGDERFVVVSALHNGMTYKEIAAYYFHDEAAWRQVERILQRARRKLKKAHQAWLDDS